MSSLLPYYHHVYHCANAAEAVAQVVVVVEEEEEDRMGIVKACIDDESRFTDTHGPHHIRRYQKLNSGNP